MSLSGVHWQKRRLPMGGVTRNSGKLQYRTVPSEQSCNTFRFEIWTDVQSVGHLGGQGILMKPLLLNLIAVRPDVAAPFIL